MIEKLRQKFASGARRREFWAWLGAVLNRTAFRLAGLSRSCVRFMNRHVTHEESDWFTHGLPSLHRKIDVVLKRQRQEYGDYYYFEAVLRALGHREFFWN